jgi:enoyl-CoA hydratase/carnithine racemase
MDEEPFVTIEGPGDDHVAVVRLNRPPNNFFSLAMIEELADALEGLDDDRHCRAVVLAAEGKHFCAGADFSSGGSNDTTTDLYRAAVRLFRTGTPTVAAVQGAAIGGGLGVAMAADFRVAAPAARFSANFARLGFHQGFGLSVTLPRVVGEQHAAALLYTGRRIGGEEAARIGLVDQLVELGPRLRRRDRRLRAAGGRVDPRHLARRPRRPGGRGDRARSPRAGPPAVHPRLRRGHEGDGRAPHPELHRRSLSAGGRSGRHPVVDPGDRRVPRSGPVATPPSAVGAVGRRLP